MLQERYQIRRKKLLEMIVLLFNQLCTLSGICCRHLGVHHLIGHG
jgi:hypothetical protein